MRARDLNLYTKDRVFADGGEPGRRALILLASTLCSSNSLQFELWRELVVAGATRLDGADPDDWGPDAQLVTKLCEWTRWLREGGPPPKKWLDGSKICEHQREVARVQRAVSLVCERSGGPAPG